jgi:hypothetical protein
MFPRSGLPSPLNRVLAGLKNIFWGRLTAVVVVWLFQMFMENVVLAEANPDSNTNANMAKATYFLLFIYISIS